MKELRPNMDNPKEKMLVIEFVRQLVGKYRITFREDRPRRSDRQNRYYWPCAVEPLADWLRGHGHAVTEDDAHETLKLACNAGYVADKNGEMIAFPKSTAKLTTKEFNEFLDRCKAYLWERYEIMMPEPGVYHEPEEEEISIVA